MTNETKAQLMQFVSDCSNLKELERIEYRSNRISGGEIPVDLQEKINEKRLTLKN